MSTTPLPTAIALVATLGVTAAALAAFLAGAPVPAGAYLLVFTGLFVLRVGGQVGVGLFRPAWLPPMDEWNFVPYRFLLPAQLAILTLMGFLVAGTVPPDPPIARGLVGFAIVYWAAMAVRYTVRMTTRPTERWLGGTIPIVFHCVLASFLFVLGASNAV
jgi:hypothetical protein